MDCRVKPGHDKWGGGTSKREKPRPGVWPGLSVCGACVRERRKAPRSKLLGGRAEVARHAGRGRPELLQAAQRVVGRLEAVGRQLDVAQLGRMLVEQRREIAV